MQEKKMNFTGYNFLLKENARSLRKSPTAQEKKLWFNFLRKYPVKFYRQRAIDRFIVDFYCSKAKLIIEIDGSQHFEQKGKAYDKERTQVIEKYGLKVIRFSNRDIERNFSGVCTAIDVKVKERLP